MTTDEPSDADLEAVEGDGDGPPPGGELEPGLWEFPAPLPSGHRLVMAVGREGHLVGTYVRRPDQADRDVREIMAGMVEDEGREPDLHLL